MWELNEQKFENYLGDVHVVHDDRGDVAGEHVDRDDGHHLSDHCRKEKRMDETGF